jgi:hypothetical protein
MPYESFGKAWRSRVSEGKWGKLGESFKFSSNSALNGVLRVSITLRPI